MPLKVGLTYNLIRKESIEGRPLDAIAELDSEETIEAVKNAIMSGGHEVVLLEADLDVYDKIKKSGVDIIFNIAEGVRGESRESHIPIICEMLGVPYTGSGPLTLSICLDKAKTKEILSYYNIPTPKHHVFKSSGDEINPSLRFPLIVKLLHEGSSMGLDNKKSIVDNERDLQKRVDYLIQTYKEPAIVEEFLDGREFTVPVLGNRELVTLPIIEIIFQAGQRINLFTPDDPIIPLVEEIRGEDVVDHTNNSVCPAQVDKELEGRLNQTAIAAFKALGVRDWCRMEMRLDADGVPNVLEVNPIAGIDPTYWLPKSARAAGMSYDQLVNNILSYAVGRYGMLEERI